jgi:dTDP-4-dehydrorhamnose reductase
MNMNDRDGAKRFSIMTHPNFVIFCAGSNDWLEAEKDERLAQAIHAGGPGNILSATEVFKPKFIYLSSDLVFSGRSGNFHEDDTTIPFLTLGKAKLSGETYIRGKSLNHVIVRSAPLLGRGTVHHPSWWDRLRRTLSMEQSVTLSHRMVHNPVHISRLIETLKKVMEKDIKNAVLHVGGDTRLSEYDLGLAIAERYQFKTGLIRGSEPVDDPDDFSLNTSKTLASLKMSTLSIEDSIERLKD